MPFHCRNSEELHLRARFFGYELGKYGNMEEVDFPVVPDPILYCIPASAFFNGALGCANCLQPFNANMQVTYFSNFWKRTQLVGPFDFRDSFCPASSRVM
jgi:hypothetical protein